jgi:hypothetical protein
VRRTTESTHALAVRPPPGSAQAVRQISEW